MPFRDRQRLIEALEAGNPVRYLFFWGHTPKGSEVDASCLSQWFPAPFEVDGQLYATAEHFMMAEKARLFGDLEMRSRILAATHPNQAKSLGRQVNGFDEAIWNANSWDIVVRANLAKFRQNPPLQEFLRQSGARVLVEASPLDRLWGIGLHRDDPRAQDPRQWEGENRLGFALMEVRQACQLH